MTRAPGAGRLGRPERPVHRRLDDRGASPAVIAGWVVMGLFLLVGILTILLSASPAQYENVFLGIVVPTAVVALVVSILLLLRGY